MCCGLACLRLDMVQPSGAESCKQFSSPSSTKFLGLGVAMWGGEEGKKKKKLPPSSRNAHVNVIIIINNALRFITVPWQLIGSGPSAHTLFKCAPPLMSGARWQEGAGGAMRVDGLRDGGRVNNTQLIAPFPRSWENNTKNTEYCHSGTQSERRIRQVWS